MNDADRKLGEEMAMMHIGGLVELGIIPPADIVERLEFDATRCEVDYSKGIAGNITEAAELIKRLREELRGALCPGGGYTGQPPDELRDVAACLKAGVCGCSLGAALAPNQTGGK